MDIDHIEKDDRVVPDDPSLLLQLTEYTNDCLWMFTPDWQELVFANSAYKDIFGASVESLNENPTSFVEAVHPDDREKVTSTMEQISTGEPADLEFRANPHNDYQTWVWVQAQPVYSDTDELEYIAGYTRDITQRKEYEQQLEKHQEALKKSNESLREFAYIASHDLQEPLRMVSSYVDLLDQEYSDELDDEAEEYMEFAVNGAQRMKRMINSLLEYSRLHTNAGEFSEIDANEIFKTIRQDLKLLIEENNAELTVEDLPRLTADPEQLGQVFQNLVKNGIEYATKEGTPSIDVTVTEDTDEYVFSVADNGPGIRSGEKEDIFKIFQQGADASNSENTGIGLAITQRIVQRHGGEIWVESERGEGATFKFSIPKGLPTETEERQN